MLRPLVSLLTVALLGGCGAAKPVSTAKPAAAPAPPAIRFTDVTREAGIDFVQSHGGCGKAYFVEQTGAGAALFDFDNDGDLDLYFPQATWLPGCEQKQPLQARLYRNDGKGHFSPVAGAAGAICKDYGIGVATADYDGDGWQDLFVSCYGRSHLFRNEHGKFRDVTQSARLNRTGYATSAAWLDYDRDGHLDLFVCGYVEFDPSMVTDCPAPDGRPDYCTPEAFTPDRNTLYRNRGDGTFEEVSARLGVAEARARALGVAATDLDGDGWTDLFVANDTAPNMLYLNRKGKRFEDNAMISAVAFGPNGKPQSNMGIACGDYDRDGDPDVLVTTFAAEPYTLYRNDGTFYSDVSSAVGLSQPTYVPLGFGTQFMDLDQDGWLDLFFANGHVEQYINQRSKTQTFAQANQVFRNAGPTGFTEVKDALPAADVKVHRGLAYGDLDGDGDLDLVITSFNDRPTVLRNDTKGGHWLALDLRDQHGSPALGARVKLEAGGATQTAWIYSGGSYLCQSDVAAHFGLGGASTASVTIRWPDGTEQALANVAADQRLVIRRGAASPSVHSRN